MAYRTSVLVAPTGTVTFLFTDIEGSTRRWESDPAVMRDELAGHDAILRTAIERHGGVVFATGGDGFAAAFRTAPDALACAAEAQQKLTVASQLRVRMGLHSGDAVERDGDYFGPAVNRAARMMSVAHGGQVLLSATTASLAERVPTRDLGEHRLKDIERPQRVFQLATPGLGGDFPPLRAFESRRIDLPAQLTSFVGRTEEIGSLRALVATHRLVTLTGVGGVGKTRSALEVASGLVDEFADDVLFCDLAVVEDEEALLPALARTIGAFTRSEEALADGIIDALHSRQSLVLVDNCEHLIDPVGMLLERILHDCPRVHLLATSREALGIPGEHIVPLRPLPTESATELFASRAAAVNPAFTIDAKNGSAVDEICQRLDGIPLAIELAAARISAMTASEIASHLDERFRLLAGGRARSVDRHATLRATVDWSYSLLEEADRLIFERLGVFAGSFDLDAAFAVASAGAVSRLDVLDALGELVAKSMIVAERVTGDSTRYSILETLRAFAAEQLAARNEAHDIARRHASYFCDRARLLGPQLETGAELAARRALEVDIDNYRAAMAWSFSAPLPDDQAIGVGIAGSLALLVTTAATASGLELWSERAVPFARLSSVATADRFSAIAGAATVAVMGADLVTAEALGREALAIGMAVARTARTSAITAVGVAMSVVDIGAAIAFLEDSAQQLSALDDDFGVAVIRGECALYRATAGDDETARAEAQLAATLARRNGSPTALVITLYAEGHTWWRDDPERARRALDECTLYTDTGATDVIYVEALELLGRVAAYASDFSAAWLALATALQYAVHRGQRMGAARAGYYLVESLGLAAVGDLEDETVATVHGLNRREDRAPGIVGVMTTDLDPYTDAVAQAQNRLGESAFLTLGALGAAMDSEQGDAFLLEQYARLSSRA